MWVCKWANHKSYYSKLLECFGYNDVSHNYLTKFISSKDAENNIVVNQILNRKLKTFYAQDNFIGDVLYLYDNLITYINVSDNKNLIKLLLNNNQIIKFTANNTAINHIEIANQHKIIENEQNNQIIEQTVYTLDEFYCDNVDFI